MESSLESEDIRHRSLEYVDVQINDSLPLCAIIFHEADEDEISGGNLSACGGLSDFLLGVAPPYLLISLR